MNRKLLFDLLYRVGTARILRLFKRGNVTLLSLHRISYESDYFFEPLRPDRFEDLIGYVITNYEVLSFSDLAEIKTLPKKPIILLTFDDGYRDFYENALPILLKYKLPSNHNVVNQCVNSGTPIWTHRLNTIFEYCMTNKIRLSFDLQHGSIDSHDFGGDWMKFYLKTFHMALDMSRTSRMQMISEKENDLSVATDCKMMNWDEINECSQFGVEIGSHTYSHDVLSEVVDDITLEREITSSKLEIEANIGKPVSVLALPNGQGNTRVNQFAEHAGFNFLLYVNDGINKYDSINSGITLFDRINVVNEPLAEAVLRTEQFHSRMRKYV